MLLEGKKAVVTGGTRGIGFAVVETFLKNGASVALFGSRQETVDKALAKLKAENPDWDVMGLAPDLTDYAAVEAAMAKVTEAFGRIDILVNNAGISAREPLYQYDPAAFKNIMDLNVTAVFNGCRAVAPIMKAQGGGAIINTSSMVSIYGQPSGVGYPTSKFAVNGLTRSLARELLDLVQIQGSCHRKNLLTAAEQERITINFLTFAVVFDPGRTLLRQI